MQDSLWTALALLLILEGMLPFVAPRVWREGFRRLTELTDGQLRFVGVVSRTSSARSAAQSPRRFARTPTGNGR